MPVKRAAITSATLFLGVLAIAVPALAQGQGVALRGAGATFPAPLYAKWMQSFGKDHPQVTMSYDAVGSGEGISRFIAESVDFGASDAALTDEQIAAVKRGALLVPTTAGMVTVAYNVPGLVGPLKLPRDVYADIFLGKITDWSDPRIRQANPDAKLEKRTIAVVARQDKSGTTFAFTSHLSAISDDWKRQRGASTWVEWPEKAMLVRGNEGVAGRIKISEGAIGYAEYGFAKRLGLQMAVLQNKAGNFVLPNERTGQSALAEGSSAIPDDLRVFVTDPEQPDSYPIVTFTWLLLYKQYPNEQKRAVLKDFVSWGLGAGQNFSADLGYIPLPESVASLGKSALVALQ